MWYALPRRGEPEQIDFANASTSIESYFEDDLRHFKSRWPPKLDYKFNIAEAKKLLAKKTEEEGAPEPE